MLADILLVLDVIPPVQAAFPLVLAVILPIPADIPLGLADIPLVLAM